MDLMLKFKIYKRNTDRGVMAIMIVFSLALATSTAIMKMIENQSPYLYLKKSVESKNNHINLVSICKNILYERFQENIAYDVLFSIDLSKGLYPKFNIHNLSCEIYDIRYLVNNIELADSVDYALLHQYKNREMVFYIRTQDSYSDNIFKIRVKVSFDENFFDFINVLKV